jgi:hypothetical protein
MAAKERAGVFQTCGRGSCSGCHILATARPPPDGACTRVVTPQYSDSAPRRIAAPFARRQQRRRGEHDDTAVHDARAATGEAIVGAATALETTGGGAPVRTPMREAADAYERAQRRRVQLGEQLRAILQGRDPACGVAPLAEADVGAMLRAVRHGLAPGPVPKLGAEYRRVAVEEREWRDQMARLASGHPAWPWLARVGGVGTTLGASLLARLDVRRARNPSAFWAYCGLATITVPRFHCALCGLTVDHGGREGRSRRHRVPGTSTPCAGVLVADGSGGNAQRVAQPRPPRGEPAPFDKRARHLCYLLGVSFLRARGKYAAIYHARRDHLEGTRPEWEPSRKHLTALRITEKLFLSHLWAVWREAEGLPVTVPYTQAAGEGTYISPWSMVEDEAET